jgi:hypothetical protein
MKFFSFLIALLFLTTFQAQNSSANDKILLSFEAYSELPREVVFVHLNKSVFIKGESIGYKAYVLDKDTKKRSLETKNLYCTVLDDQKKVIKKQLIKIENGLGSGLIKVDSLFTTGTYHFQSYTNWMRNFSEPNYFEQSLTILDPEETTEVKTEAKKVVVDAQFLPESGHALTGVNSIFGVIIKDDNGFGFPFLEGKVEDPNGKMVASFKLNSFGVGRFALIPKDGINYHAVFTINNENFKIPIGFIEKQGITCTIQDLRDKVGLILNAKLNVPSQREQNFMLTLHNGDSIKAVDISFAEAPQAIKVFPKEDLYPGINVFTLFDSSGTPVLERLYFNHQGVAIHKATDPSIEFVSDSVKLTFSVKGIDPKYYNSLSVSVLPSATETYKAHHNLPSYALLNPYVKGPVEKASYYFTDRTPRKAYELDNLLITQGWSSYEWNKIRIAAPKYLYDFEKGISYIVTLNGKDSNDFFISPTTNNTSEFITIGDGQKIFSKDNFYPISNEKLGVAEIGKNGLWQQPKIFVQFKPTFIPPLGVTKVSVLENKMAQVLQESGNAAESFEGFYQVQMLDEVVLIEKSEEQRIEKLRNSTVGRVEVFDEDDWRRNMYLSTYLSSKGYAIDESNGVFTIVSRNPNSLNNATPAIFLDGVLLTNFSILYRFLMDTVDYIEVNSSGVGGGIRGGGGIIKIVTDPSRAVRTQGGQSLTTYDIPLTFSSDKRFYNPMYNTYNGTFYNTFGAVDWHPNVIIDTNGKGQFSFLNYGLPAVKLFIEGIVNDDEFVSDVKEVKLQ